MPTTPKAKPLNFNDPASIQGYLQSATDKANKANEKRYQQGLGLFNSAISNTQNVGATGKQDLQDQLQNNTGSAVQSATSRGLGNTTILDSMKAMQQRTYNRGLTNLNESVANQQNNLGLQKANFIASRNDVAPDVGMFAQLAQAAAAAPRPQQNVTQTMGGYAMPSDQSSISAAIAPQQYGDTGGGNYHPIPSTGMYLGAGQAGSLDLGPRIPNGPIQDAVSPSPAPSPNTTQFQQVGGPPIPDNTMKKSGLVPKIGMNGSVYWSQA